MPTILLILFFLGIIFWEVPPLLRQKMWRELIVSSLLLALGFGLCLGQLLGFPFPSIAGIIAAIFRIRY